MMGKEDEGLLLGASLFLGLEHLRNPSSYNLQTDYEIYN